MCACVHVCAGGGGGGGGGGAVMGVEPCISNNDHPSAFFRHFHNIQTCFMDPSRYWWMEALLAYNQLLCCFPCGHWCAVLHTHKHTVSCVHTHTAG